MAARLAQPWQAAAAHVRCLRGGPQAPLLPSSPVISPEDQVCQSAGHAHMSGALRRLFCDLCPPWNAIKLTLNESWLHLSFRGH